MSKKLSLRPDFMFFFMLEATGFIKCKSFCQFCATITKKNTEMVPMATWRIHPETVGGENSTFGKHT